METKPAIPTGLEHLALVRRGGAYIANESATHADEFKINNEIIGTCLSALYQAATCHRQCHGGGHVFENLCGRAYNLGCAAYDLTQLGLYDEALNLTRSLAEITNLIMLLSFDQSQIQKWIKSDRKTRMREFSPVNIRRQLETHGHICADDDWYREMSENYSHPTPGVRPNEHGGVPWIGGKFDKDDAGACYGRLMYALTMLSMFVCRWFKFDDLFKEISNGLREVKEDGKKTTDKA